MVLIALEQSQVWDHASPVGHAFPAGHTSSAVSSSLGYLLSGYTALGKVSTGSLPWSQVGSLGKSLMGMWVC